MRITTVGFLTDHKSRVFLHGAAGPSPVVAPLEVGRLPADSLADAFRLETGLIVLPVRLVGVYYERRDGGALALSYRCTMRGGELKGAEGPPQAGFFETHLLPRSLGTTYRRQLEDALRHGGGPAVTAQLNGGLWSLWRKRKNQAARLPDWTVTARLVVDGGHGQVAWTRRAVDGTWRLPAAVVGPGEAPWATAERLRRTLRLDRTSTRPTLRLLLLDAARPSLSLVFIAGLHEPPSPRAPGETVSFVSPDESADGFDAADRALAVEALSRSDATLVHLDA